MWSLFQNHPWLFPGQPDHQAKWHLLQVISWWAPQVLTLVSHAGWSSLFLSMSHCHPIPGTWTFTKSRLASLSFNLFSDSKHIHSFTTSESVGPGGSSGLIPFRLSLTGGGSPVNGTLLGKDPCMVHGRVSVIHLLPLSIPSQLHILVVLFGYVVQTKLTPMCKWPQLSYWKKTVVYYDTLKVGNGFSCDCG